MRLVIHHSYFTTLLFVVFCGLCSCSEDPVDSHWLSIETGHTLSITSGKDNNIWVGTMVGNLLQINNANTNYWDHINTNGAIGSYSSIWAGTTDSSGNVWFTSDSGIVSKVDDIWTNYANTDTVCGLGRNRHLSIKFDSKNSLWAAGSCLVKFDGKIWNTYNSENTSGKIPGTGLGTIDIDQLDNVWFSCSDNGVVSFDGNSWHNYNYTNTGGGLASNTINGIAHDRDNNIWFATDSGLCKYDHIKWEVYSPITTNNVIKSGKIYSVAVDKNNTVWVGGYKSIYKISQGKITEVYSDDPKILIGDDPYTIIVDGQNNKWFGFYDKEYILRYSDD
jgi:ligand-binding sensor domain-containing protein